MAAFAPKHPFNVVNLLIKTEVVWINVEIKN